MGSMIDRLLPTKKLKTGVLKEVADGKRGVYIRYDSEFDALMVLFVKPSTPTVVHYAEDSMALLYEPRSREIVGFQIEAFERAFLPKHETMQSVWKLSDSIGVQSFGDMIIQVEQTKPIVTQEVFKASESLLESVGISSSLKRRLINSSNLVPA